MANPFRDMSVIMQGLLALAITVVLVVVGVYVPGSPVAQERDEVDKAGWIRSRPLFRKKKKRTNSFDWYRERRRPRTCN